MRSEGYGSRRVSGSVYLLNAEVAYKREVVGQENSHAQTLSAYNEYLQ